MVRVLRRKPSGILSSGEYRNVPEVSVRIQSRTDSTEILQIKGESNLVIRVGFADFEKGDLRRL